ncbi:039R [Cherax quadricarinatus iridovirus]|uniref:039R n=1 Tax=Cherax quadricarinatus iridovirus TaxID=2035708 RepID=UPI000BC04093|nr:039R [Cherax quadricarinatus iridovirus]ASZ85019.1 039R [Cherax quadricarinatus iridovirus]
MFLKSQGIMRVILTQFNKTKIEKILRNKYLEKLYIFDDDTYENFRPCFLQFHKIYKDKITFYEGNVKYNLDAFLKHRKSEGLSYSSFVFVS